MKKFKVKVNGGVYYGDNGKSVFDEEELKVELVKWNGGKNEFKLEDEVVDVVGLIDVCGWGKVEVYEESMVEMGDDYVELGLVEIK